MMSEPRSLLSADFPIEARQRVQSLRASRIREVANAGMGRDDVLPFWFGEPDEVTPALIRDAAKQALDAGDTFYTHNMGTPALRAAIAAYASRLHRPVDADRIAVTSSGVSALMLVAQLLVNPGDRVVAVTPLWPNLLEIPRILGADVVSVPLQLNTAGDTPRWELDLDQLLDALVPGTRALLLNSPNNPTGWVISREQQEQVLTHCRKHGIWLMADDVYERLVYDTPAGQIACAPSFLDLAEPDERVVSTNSFSKSFLMTGWRLGWLVLPPSLTQAMGKLIEFNTSCASVFTQRAGIAALQHTDQITPQVVAHLKQCRDTLVPLLQAVPGVELAPARGGMYAFFKLAGHPDSVTTAKRLVVEAGLGLAPGEAFASQAQGWLRWCFASQDLSRLAQGVDRLRAWL